MMKEIKAYVRSEKVDAICEGLAEAQCPGVTLVPVNPVGYGFNPNYSISLGGETESAEKGITKLEIVCDDQDVDKFCEVIRMRGYTGFAGDGIIFVSPIACALKVRTGLRDADALSGTTKREHTNPECDGS